VAENKTGYFGVCCLYLGKPKPYQARVWRGGKKLHLGYLATAEEAALCVARTPEGQAVAAAERAAAAPPLTSEEARQQAEAEKLKLRVADNSAGYFGVYLNNPGRPKPYQVQVRRGDKMVYLGCFAIAEEAALCVARSPEGRAAAAESQGTLPAVHCRLAPASRRRTRSRPHVPPGAFVKEEGVVPLMPPGAFVKEEGVVPLMPPGAFVKDEGVVPLMPPDAFVKVEVVVKEEEGSDGRPKRQRAK
jgi:hypothetical protein